MAGSRDAKIVRKLAATHAQIRNHVDQDCCFNRRDILKQYRTFALAERPHLAERKSAAYDRPAPSRSNRQCCWKVSPSAKHHRPRQIVIGEVLHYRLRLAFTLFAFKAPGFRPSPIFFAISLRCLA